MRKRMILAPGLNGTEILRNLALQGVNCINERFCGASELAGEAFMCSGISPGQEMITYREENALIAKALEGESYFGEVKYSDVQEVAAAIRRMRSLVTAGDEAAVLKDNLSKGLFEEKNKALFNVYCNYMQLLQQRNALDRIAFIKKAVAECGPMDADIIVLEEYPLNPIEEALAQKVSGGKLQCCKLTDLYQISPDKVQISSYKNCYGVPNEVETVLQSIYENKAMDRCVVALTDAATYSQSFFDYALLYDIPVTFGCGIPIINSNPAKLLKEYNAWMTEQYFDGNALCVMLQSKLFDSSKLYETFGISGEELPRQSFYGILKSIRLTNQSEVNQIRFEALKNALAKEVKEAGEDEKAKVLQKQSCLPYVELLAKELALPAEEFIAKYAYIRKGSTTHTESMLMKLDMAAVVAIYEELSVVRTAGMSQAAGDIIQSVLGRSVCRQSSCEGALHITEIGRALSCIREHVYIVGLSATKYPGSPRENYLLLDDDLHHFGEGANAQTSEGRILRKRELLMHLVRLASALHSKIYVSYAGLNVSDLKKDNASSLVFELYREEIGRDVTIGDLEEKVEVVGYFEPAISPAREIGKAYNRNQKVTGQAVSEVAPEPVALKADGEYSPTALNTFFECPRKYMFKYVLNIPEPDEADLFEVISAAETGTLTHSLMELLAGSNMDKEAFCEMAQEHFERFMAQNPPVITANVKREKEEFLEMMKNAYDMRPTGRVVSQEKEEVFRHESGVILKGIPDCVEEIGNNRYRIIDYKTGRSVTHKENDIDTCFQIVVYAYLMESKGLNVVEGEFRYLRLDETVKCVYNAEMKLKLAEKLAVFKENVENACFQCVKRENGGDEPAVCKYCKYGSICGKQ